jgi:pimeloyl-ACP methyl ester carboxylesterase
MGAGNETLKDAHCRSLRQNRQMKTTERKMACVLLLSASLIASCASAPRTQVVAVAESTDCVVLLHGLNRSWRMMRPMAKALQEAGFTTANVDYPSQAGPIEEIAPLAVGTGLAACRALGAQRIHFVTHSIGGILLRYENERAPIADLGRVVMLGPPNQGSEIVDITKDWPGVAMFGGAAGLQLGTDETSIPSRLGPVDFELGVIAGTGTINFWMSAMLPDEDDGKVTVAATQVDGMDDFLVVTNSHHYITHSDIVFRNTASFLKTGRFIDADKSFTTGCVEQAGGNDQSAVACL